MQTITRSLPWTVCLSLGTLGATAGKPPAAASRVTLIDVRRIWDRAPHNAFSDLIRFHERWFCVFREGQAHVSPDGALRVICSTDAREWTSAALIKRTGADLRDAKITVTPDGRLMLSGAAAVHQPADYKHQSLTWFSGDGFVWGDAHEVGDRNVWLWRTTWHRGKAYGIGYSTAGERFARLYASDDGVHFEVLAETVFNDGFPNETSLVFRKDDSCCCLLRRDGDPGSAQLGTARPPYSDWTWQDLGVRIGGPNMLLLPDDRLIAAVRLYDGGTRTALCWVDPTAGTLTECLRLPSGGDTSYAGLVWYDDCLWVSYYSAHEAAAGRPKTAIYLAKVAISGLSPATAGSRKDP